MYFGCGNPLHDGGMTYGYARVSTDGHTVAEQVEALTVAGAVKVFRDTASGTQTDHTKSLEVLAQLDAGDALTVTRLDRLARSTRDLLNTLATVADPKAGFRSLGDTWADTTTAHGRVTLAVLGGLADFERELIRTRTSEGLARAMARGVKLGRKPKLTTRQIKEILLRKGNGEAVREIALSYNVHNSTISRVS